MASVIELTPQAQFQLRRLWQECVRVGRLNGNVKGGGFLTPEQAADVAKVGEWARVLGSQPAPTPVSPARPAPAPRAPRPTP